MPDPENIFALPRNMALGVVTPIEGSAGQPISHRSDLERLVDSPALAACQTLYDKNICTTSASANRESTDEAYVIIDYDSLSDRNKAIGLAHGEAVSAVRLADSIPKITPDSIMLVAKIDETDTPETISTKLQDLALLFHKQPLTWAPTYTLDQIKAVHGYEPGEEATKGDFIELGFYYDDWTGLFHLSEEIFEKSSD